MKIFIPLLVLLAGCTGRTPSTADTKEMSNVIDLSNGLKNIKTVRLSDIADSVSLLPLETTRQSLFGATKEYIKFTPSYIFYFSSYFDWNGKFCGKIGNRGNGPLEEPQGVFNVLFTDNHFYSKGSKFIEYDITGKPTRKVMSLYSVSDLYAGKNPGFLLNGTDFFAEGTDLVIYDYPSTLYFFDRNFEIVSSRIVTKVEDDQIVPGNVGNHVYVTHYKDHALFYNFMNDTIFDVRNTDLEPRWVVHFDDPLRLPAQAIANLNNRDFIAEAAIFARSGRFEDSKFAQLAENKHMVTAVYETEAYLFFLMTEIVFMAERRGKQPAMPYVVCYEKNSGQTFRINGNGFVDDLLGLDEFFYPSLGIYDEKLIISIWPHELLEYLKDNKITDRKVNPQLLALSKQVKEDDNPIIIFVHLKK